LAQGFSDIHYKSIIVDILFTEHNTYINAVLDTTNIYIISIQRKYNMRTSFDHVLPGRSHIVMKSTNETLRNKTQLSKDANN